MDYKEVDSGSAPIQHQPSYSSPPPLPPQQQQHQTMVIVSQPQANPRGQPQNIRGWSTGLCGCCEDCGSCLYCTFCYPCFMCTLAQRMGEDCCGPMCCAALFMSSMRTKIRTQYGIKGSISEDIMCVTCCEMCAMHQIHRELNNIDRLN